MRQALIRSSAARTLAVFLIVILTDSINAAADGPHRSALSRIEKGSESGDVGVIIEFRTEPLLRRGKFLKTASQRKELEVTFERLELDLARLIGASGTAEKTSRRIQHRYTFAFAGASASVPPHAIRDIARLDYVARVHPDRQVEAFLEESVGHIGAPEVWASLGTRGEGVTVAVLDSGIAYTHPAFGGTFGPGSRVRGGFDFANDDADPMDDNGHGTHVAGIIGGDGGGVTGVAPAVSLLAYKVLNAGGFGSSSDIIAAIESSVDPDGDGDTSDRADVVNMSLGGLARPDDPIVAAVETAIEAGVVFVIAAGNSSRFFGVGSPAVAPSAIAVGASGRSDDALADFSSRGPVQGSGALKPEIVAPGVRIQSASPDGGRFQASGTSMAAPHVAGVAAILKELHPGWTPEQIKSAIVNTAVLIDSETMAGGAGRVDAFAATRARVIAEPSVVSFGVGDLTVEQWMTDQTILIRNTSGEEVTLAATTTGTDANIVLSLEPSTLTIPAGESRELTIGLSVANGAFPTPLEDSLSFGGHVLLEGGDVRMNLPWAFVKAAKTTLRFGESQVNEVLFSSSTRWDSFFSFSESLDVILPPGEYDIVVQSGLGPGSALLILEQQSILGAVTIEPDVADATTLITLEASDPGGGRLQGVNDRPCSNIAMLLLPEGSDREWWSVTHAGPLRVSPASGRFRLLPVEFCWTSSQLWLAQHDPIEDLTSNVTSTLSADRWITQSARVAGPAELEDLSLVVLGVMEWRGTQTPGSGGYFRVLPVEGSVWSGEVHFTADVAEKTGGAMLLSLTSDSRGDLLDTPSLRPLDGRVSPIVHENPAPLTYRPQPGETLRFGRGALYPETFIGVTEERILASLFWSGPLNEFQLDVSSGQVLTITYPDGSEFQAEGFRYTSPLTLGGIYEVESRTSFRMGDGTGEETVTARFDSNRYDNVTPTFTSLRILDPGGRASSAVRGAASLVFSVADNERIAGRFGVLRAPVPADLVRVWARVHGTEEWEPLAVTHLLDDVGEIEQLGRLGTGSVFRVDLSEVTAARGLFDLRIEAADTSGNSIELISAPAFAVPGDRQRPARR